MAPLFSLPEISLLKETKSFRHSPRDCLKICDGGGGLLRDGEQPQGRCACREEGSAPGHIPIPPGSEVSARSHCRNNHWVCGQFSTSRGLDSKAASATPCEELTPGCRPEARDKDGEASPCTSLAFLLLPPLSFFKNRFCCRLLACCRETCVNRSMRLPASLKASTCMERGRLCPGMPASCPTDPACTTHRKLCPPVCAVGLRAATERNSVG